jgi:CTP:molybdopterin cytidylyltransferase MocA
VRDGSPAPAPGGPGPSRGGTLSAIAALILAAGGGRRFGGPKALARVDGVLLVDRAVATARAAGCDPVLVVVGAAADDVRAQADLAGVAVVENPSWRTGMASSLKAGLAALAQTPAQATAVLLVDMPGVGAEAVRRVAQGADAAALRTATYEGRRGHPVVLGRDRWSGVAALASADVGARAYLVAHASELVTVPCEDVADDADIDEKPAD